MQVDLKEDTMDRHTCDGTIRAFKHRTPFRPFTVAMVNGHRLEVDHEWKDLIAAPRTYSI